MNEKITFAEAVERAKSIRERSENARMEATKLDSEVDIMAEHRVLVDDVLYIVEDDKIEKLKTWLNKNGLEAGEVKNTDLDSEDIVYEFEATESASNKIPEAVLNEEKPRRRSKKNA